MKKIKNVKIAYDSEADVLSWEGDKAARIDHAKEMGNLVVHFTKTGEPVLVEMLEASKTFRQNRKFISPLRKLVAA